MLAVLACAMAYLVGSIPFGYLLVRATRGVDVRGYGSHSIGAINVTRVAGLPMGLLTLAADVGKAYLALLSAGAMTDAPATIAAAGFLVMLGHAYSPWFLLRDRRFSEAKSVACALGVMLGLVSLAVLPWRFALAPLAVWAAGLLLPRLLTGRWYWISPATMVASACIPLAVWAAHPPRAYLLLSFGMAALILVRHTRNIGRLMTGAEPRLGDRLGPVASNPPHRTTSVLAEGRRS